MLRIVEEWTSTKIFQSESTRFTSEIKLSFDEIVVIFIYAYLETLFNISSR